ncbi:MAG: MBL fold metallo-hydrolase [Thermoleophilia bacterium]|nr:MBL fold metallo-hydrolase [Thermoleophilia bacterium]
MGQASESLINAHSKVQVIPVFWPQVQGSLNVYLIRGAKLALVDTAAYGADLKQALNERGLSPQDIDLVLNTHGHPDHTGNNAFMKNEGGASIWIHADDAVCVEDHARYYEEFHLPVFAALRGSEEASKHKAVFLEFAGPDCPVDRRLQDGEVVDLGDGVTVEVVGLPGHTPGSVGFWIEEEKVLITGDSTPGLGGPDGSLPVIADVSTYQASLRRLLERDIRVLHTTHPFRSPSSPPATIREGDEVKRFLSESLEFAQLLEARLEAEVETAERDGVLVAADRVIEGLPAALGFKPISQLFMPDMALATIVANFRRLKGI